MKFGIVVFPGTWSDKDFYHVIKYTLNQEVKYIWHKDIHLSNFDCIILPGGFSYGDYLRPGSIARFSTIMKAIEEFANNGGLVMGSCNGFQILCEAGLLPGVLMRNNCLQYRCQWTYLRVENNWCAFTASIATGTVIKIPISHGEGNYYIDKDSLLELNKKNRIVFRYCTKDGGVTSEINPNGSIENIAGICNEKGNVLGLMPHPERCCEKILGTSDGALLLKSALKFLMD